jgi:FtsP/CotA-like multicopper oxidase with cupredoxin domain
VPFQFIANDGNLVVHPISSTQLSGGSLDQQGIAERYDIVIDFSAFPINSEIRVVNRLVMRPDGTGPDGAVSLSQALGGSSSDPLVGTWMKFRVVDQVPSVDVPGYTLTVANSCGSNDKSRVPAQLTQQIPIVTPVRTRFVEFDKDFRDDGDSRDSQTGECTPDCPEFATFPWNISVNGERSHTFNANRVSLLVPKPGEVEHWTFVNSGRSWDHPIHLHFEEGVTISRNGSSRSWGGSWGDDDSIPPTEELVRKDVWRLRRNGSVTFQVQFGEFGGSYVNHCHNTVHEDFAMLMRIQLLTGVLGSPQVAVTPTPNPTPDGVFFTSPEILPEANPSSGGGGGGGWGH